MTVTHRKRAVPDETQVVVNEPGLHVECDGCRSDLTHSVRIKCADPICEPGEGVDICPRCYTQGKEFGQHKKSHPYRIIELHSYPIFDQDWGADEELLLNEGLTLQGLGNWAAVAEHVGTRTKEEIEQHYSSVYIDSPDYPLPRMKLSFNISTSEFQARKKRRIEALSSAVTATSVVPKVAPTSAPGVHEIATYLPGRLEFEHELDNEAEDAVKDLEFGVVMDYGGHELPEDENDNDVKARKRWEESRKDQKPLKRKRMDSNTPQPNGKLMSNGVNGHLTNGYAKFKLKSEDPETRDVSEAATAAEGDSNGDESTAPLLPTETQESIRFKLSLLDMYLQRVAKRHEAKAFIFERGLLEYKKMLAADKKRAKEEREFVHKFRPYAKLQTAEDYEEFVNGMLYESMLRRRIQELQHYRRLGITSSGEAERYESDFYHRANPALQRDQSMDRSSHIHRQGSRASFPPDSTGNGDQEGRRSRDPEPSKVGPSGRKPVAPLNLANAPSLHLLTAPEQTLCSQLRILPKAYLVIKETLVREFARRGGKLRRREARELVKIDVNKTSRVWDFLVQAGVLRVPEEVAMSAPTYVLPFVVNRNGG
ncbi:SWIRM-domain-containing protein [Ramaria rubella]|nr:SWIRM-domain-containing protein [Ramaria rubella]